MNIKITHLRFLILVNIIALAMDQPVVSSAKFAALVKCPEAEFTQKVNATPHILDVIDAEGKSILHHAADAANLHVITIALEKSMSVELQDKEGDTPIHLIRCDRQMPYQINKCTKTLLDLKSHYKYPDGWNNYPLLAVKNNKGQTPVDVVLYFRNLPVISIFYQVALDWFGRLDSQKKEKHRNIAQEIRDKVEAQLKDDECLRVRIILHSDVVIEQWEKERNELLKKIENLEKQKKESDKNNASIVTGLLHLL